MEKFTRVPPKKEKSKNNYRHTEFLCPECYSTLEYHKDFSKYCSGDRLKLWEKLFRKYENATETKRMDILAGIEDTAKFKEWFEKWSYKNSKGKRSKFVCEYSNRLFDLHRDNNTLVPDPIMLSRIERDLGKSLDINKLDEDTVFYHDGAKYSEKPTDKSTVVKLEWVRYPDDV